MSKYYQTEEYNEMLERLLANKADLEKINQHGISIGIISSTSKRKKNDRLVRADCRKTAEFYKAFVPYDFLVTVYEPNCIDLTEEQMEILLYHELLHVGVEETATGIRTYIRGHDLEDFVSIIDQYGTYWDKTRADDED